MISYKSLENIDIEILHNTFVNAFSDYQVKMDLPLSKFQQMLLRRGYNSKISMGAFQNGELVGFVLNGLRDWNNVLTAYDTGTGTVNEYRKQGITSNLIQHTKELLKEAQVKQYLLEVIKSNVAALELYKKAGFEIIREFECFKLDKDKFIPTSKYEVKNISKLDLNDWKRVAEFWDFQPSWQNSVDSVNAVNTVSYSVVCLDNKIVAYGIIDKITGDIAQLAVEKSYRRRGISRSIVSNLLSFTESNKIAILNVDSQCESIIKFLYDMGFDYYVGQYEMMLKL